MFDCSVLKQYSLGGKTFTDQETISKGGAAGIEELVPVAQAGTLSTRTDANTGILTMDSEDHGISTGDKIDIYFDGGARRNVKVGTVSADSVPIDLGMGDDLPDADTVVQAAIVQVYTTNIIGDDISALLAGADFTRSQIRLTSLLSHTTRLPFGASSPVTVFTLPANAVVESVKVDVDVAFDGSAPTVKVGIGGTTNKYMDTGDNNLKVIGSYTHSPGLHADVTTNAIILTYAADSSTDGFARVTVYYRVEAKDLDLPANECYGWTDTDGSTNPIEGDTIDEVHVTINDTTTARNVRVAALLDN